MNYYPKVSIVIPTLNEEKNLPGCLDSISRLDYRTEKLEVIVADNGSTDRTREIAEAYGAKVCRDDHATISGLRNLGVSVSTGELIAFLDADCLVAEDWIVQALKYYDNGEVVAWGAPPMPCEHPTWVQRTWFLVRKTDRPVQQVPWLETMNFWIRRDTFLAIGGFSKALVTCEDVDLSYRLHRIGSILSDSSIRVFHLGEAATVREFIKKERWRGQSNWRAVRSYGWKMRDLPTLIIPLHFGILLPLSILVLLFHPSSGWLAVTIALILLPTLGAFYRLRNKDLSTRDLVPLFLVLQIYFLSRASSLFGLK